MTRSAPYQPLLLRILHSLSGTLAIAAIISGFLVYNTFDKRFGKLPIPKINPIQDIHGTVGLFFLLLLPVFVIYSFHAGSKRLLQSDSIQKLSEFNRPIWWVTLQRLANTLMLIASVLAVTSGRMMKEEWLPLGELDHIWYSCHLIAWLVMFVCLAIHLLMSAKVGGLTLLLSMISGKFRPEDNPKHWLNHLRSWWGNFPGNVKGEVSKLFENNLILGLIEVFIFLGIIAAFVLPLFFASGD
ncbi:MAG: cytochrome b/b6 domain-containing protein [Nostocales cyanobacterium]|nr:MAG: cytochrome b/b6 domain-containing protein [Nostocales cyanobacterium]TAF13336.1 MAG: cytochrome b/b6 domain-containing protein [Nostocales cyanobacterium]